MIRLVFDGQSPYGFSGNVNWLQLSASVATGASQPFGGCRRSASIGRVFPMASTTQLEFADVNLCCASCGDGFVFTDLTIAVPPEITK